MNDAIFQIEQGIAIPARTIPNAGPRESKYPVDKLQPGQAFAVPVKDEKEARQKQSQMSGLAKTRGIKLVTRFFRDGEQSPFANTPAPCLGVWHGGEAEKKAEGEQAEGTADTNADDQQDATQVEASDAAGADDTLVL